MNKLPPEIISYIARCVLQTDCESDTRPIIPLTHVCKYWRNSIVSAPENWTRISNRRTRLAKLSLERTKAVPLEVLILFGFGRKTFPLLLPHANKVVILRCTGLTAVEELTQALPNFPKSMPNLQSLTLAGHEVHTTGNQRRIIDPFDFTHTTLRKLSWQNLPLSPSILGPRTLTEFHLHDTGCNLHVDTLLEFLEKNQSLQRARLNINFGEDPLRRSRRQMPIKSRLQHLFIFCNDKEDVKPLISNIALREGATLELVDTGSGGLGRIISGVSMTHLPGLSSPISMEYQLFPRRIQLVETDGCFLYIDLSNEGCLRFGEEFPLLPLASIRKLCLKGYGPWVPPQFQLPPFPSLEILAVDGHNMGNSFDHKFIPNLTRLDGGSIVPPLFPALPDPASSPSVKTLAFLDCAITEEFMVKLAWVAIERRNRTPISLHRVVIMNSKGTFPSAGSIKRLRKFVPVVEVVEGKELPKDLS